MGKLKVLPAQIANMIAAGEVVQRPASVVKELMENAVDAGASDIKVIISDAGRTLIQVIDNGSGMSPADALLCFERHATSKIADPEDLEAILTYGFRGEALASIAAVSEISLKSRRSQDQTATEVRIGESGIIKTGSCSAPVGSNFAIRNLFYNTPARRKFLKSDNVELKHIIEEFTRVAITRPEISFSLCSNGRDIYVLKAAKSLKFRVLDLMGSTVTEDVVDLTADTEIVKISGFVGRPESARKTLGNQYFFVNGRYFRSPYLHKAVMKAYEEMIPNGVTPSYFIYFEIDPSTIDVNIHPTKTEIKFEEESIIFQTLYACIKETLGRNSFGASIDFNTEGAIELPVIGKNFDQYRAVSQPGPSLDTSFNPFVDSEITFNSQAKTINIPSQNVDHRQDYGRLFETAQSTNNRVLIVQGKYIITPAASGMMVINIKRARERIAYDKALRALSKGEHVTQTAMFPVKVNVGTMQKLLFDDNSALLENLGFDIAPEGLDTLIINGVPEGYSCEQGKVETMISDLAAILSEACVSLPEIMQQTMAQRFASLDVANSQVLNSPMEAQRLIDTLFASDNAEITSDGRRIICVIPTEELDKNF